MPEYQTYSDQLHKGGKAEKKALKAERKRIRRSAWMDEDLREINICKGVTIDQSVYRIGENRYITLIIKGIVVYLITAGGIGSYLSALEINFSGWIFHLVIFTTAILCATLYHSWKSENLGYLIFFSVYATALILFRDYINSGFYAILNDTNDYASTYFRTEGLTHYNERIANRYVAITVAVTLIGIAANILLNNYILRRARYMIAAFLGITINLIPIYMEKEPAIIYSLMLMTGVCMTFVLKAGRHFTLSRNDHVFKRRKWGLSYGLDHKSLLHGSLLVLGLVVIMANIVNMVRPKEEYRAYVTPNPYKEATREDMQNFIMLGFAGLLNWYPNNGGLSTGELGGVSSIRLDYQPDIKITFTPYSYNSLYIKNFSGQSYIPMANRWRQSEDYMLAEEENLYEAETLKKAYESGEKTAAKGRMLITNVEAAPQTYHPYYTADEPGILYVKEVQEYEYYPLLDSDLLVQEDDTYIDPRYLEVPEVNVETVNRLVQDAGLVFGDDPEFAAARLKNYYQQNIPYTIRPGATPRGQDFVNYFLSDNRKGYCAHFASAATLAFRAIGIPARYCEGYTVSYSQILNNGEMEENGTELYSDYYEGYNQLGETALISVEATDANAHAWVEIYVEGKGWMVADVTPSSTLEEDDETSSFWDFFNNVFGDGDEDNSNESGGGGGGGFNLAIGDGTMRIVAIVLIIGISGVFLFFLGRKLKPEIVYHIRFRKGDRSEKLILYYSRRIRRRRKDKELRSCVNYREQTECLYDRRREAGAPDTEFIQYRPPERRDGKRVDHESLEELISALEYAGFSEGEINEETFNRAVSKIDELFGK